MTRGFVCTKSGAPIDGELQGDGRWCSARPAHLHNRQGDGYVNARPAWETVPSNGKVIWPVASSHGDPAGSPEPAQDRPLVKLVRLSDVVPTHVSWLWRARIPLGKLTVLDGDPGLGKSAVTMDLAARVSRGLRMPDGSRPDLDGPAGVVLLVSEDGLDDTVRPRLDAAGGDPSRVAALQIVVDVKEEVSRDGKVSIKRTPRPPTIADIAKLRLAIADVDARLVIIDPVMAYLPGKADGNKDQDVRTVLTPLAGLAEESGVAVVIVRHLNKAGGGNPLYRGGGSIGFIGAARSGLLIAADPTDETGRRRVLASTKNNLAAPTPSLVYHLEGTDGGAVRVVWEGESTQTARDLLAQPPDPEDRGALSEACDFLRELLPAGMARKSKDVERAAREAGIATITLRRAKKRLGVVVKKQSGDAPHWTWSLPVDDEHLDHHDHLDHLDHLGESPDPFEWDAPGGWEDDQGDQGDQPYRE